MKNFKFIWNVIQKIMFQWHLNYYSCFHEVWTKIQILHSGKYLWMPPHLLRAVMFIQTSMWTSTCSTQYHTALYSCCSYQYFLEIHTPWPLCHGRNSWALKSSDHFRDIWVFQFPWQPGYLWYHGLQIGWKLTSGDRRLYRGTGLVYCHNLIN